MPCHLNIDWTYLLFWLWLIDDINTQVLLTLKNRSKHKSLTGRSSETFITTNYIFLFLWTMHHVCVFHIWRWHYWPQILRHFLKIFSSSRNGFVLNLQILFPIPLHQQHMEEIEFLGFARSQGFCKDQTCNLGF